MMYGTCYCFSLKYSQYSSLQGCHNPPCGTGELDGGPERAENFFKILKEMTFAWVDVAPPATPPPTRMPTPLPTLNPTKGETAQPFSLPEIGEPISS